MKNSDHYRIMANVGLVCGIMNKEFVSGLVWFVGMFIISAIYMYFELKDN